MSQILKVGWLTTRLTSYLTPSIFWTLPARNCICNVALTSFWGFIMLVLLLLKHSSDQRALTQPNRIHLQSCNVYKVDNTAQVQGCHLSSLPNSCSPPRRHFEGSAFWKTYLSALLLAQVNHNTLQRRLLGPTLLCLIGQGKAACPIIHLQVLSLAHEGDWTSVTRHWLDHYRRLGFTQKQE